VELGGGGMGPGIGVEEEKKVVVAENLQH